MWTKIVNRLGFWTRKQIAYQYVSPHAVWWGRYQELKRRNGGEIPLGRIPS